jgi:phosphocarrier protein HPr
VTRREVVIVNAMGLHARAAARFVQTASRFRSRVVVTRGASSADGKSILGLLALLATSGSRLEITTEGPDEAEAARVLAELVSARFGEAQ